MLEHHDIRIPKNNVTARTELGPILWRDHLLGYGLGHPSLAFGGPPPKPSIGNRLQESLEGRVDIRLSPKRRRAQCLAGHSGIVTPACGDIRQDLEMLRCKPARTGEGFRHRSNFIGSRDGSLPPVLRELCHETDEGGLRGEER